MELQEEMYRKFLAALRDALFERMRREEGERATNLQQFIRNEQIDKLDKWRSYDCAAAMLTQRCLGMDRKVLARNGTFPVVVKEVLHFADQVCPIKHACKVMPPSEEDQARLVERLREALRVL